MSQVRMCDRCGDLFSENADGWQAFQAATLKRTPQGGRTSVMTVLDACPKCAVTLDADIPTPQIPARAAAADHDHDAADD